MSDLSMIIIAIVSFIAAPVNLVVFVHLVTAAVSSELRGQRNEPSDWNRTIMWGVVWVCVAIVWIVAIGVASTL